MINAYAGNIVAAALVLSAVPALGVMLWVLMDPTALGINIDKWLGLDVVSSSLCFIPIRTRTHSTHALVHLDRTYTPL